jgi:RNA polymerase sigma factor (sigma-70 family)
MVERLNETLSQVEPAYSVAETRQPSGPLEHQILFAEKPTGEIDASPAEQDLIASARQGDTAAFGELIKRHYANCLKRASSLIRNPTDAEDEVQNACWKAFERLAQFRGEGTFSAWLSRIVENQCLMRIREDRQAHFLYLDQSSESNVRVELVAQATRKPSAVGDLTHSAFIEERHDAQRC